MLQVDLDVLSKRGDCTPTTGTGNNAHACFVTWVADYEGHGLLVRAVIRYRPALVPSVHTVVHPLSNRLDLQGSEI